MSRKHLKQGRNALAVEVFAPEKNDLAMTWVDWNPTPPDKDMGLWKDVYLTSSGDVVLRHPFVHSALEQGYTTAALTITADLHNLLPQATTSTVTAEIDGITVSQKFRWRVPNRRLWFSLPNIILSFASAIRACGGPTRWAHRNCTLRNRGRS